MNRPPILNECHICGEPHTLTRMVHKWNYSYCLTCWQDIEQQQQQTERNNTMTNYYQLLTAIHQVAPNATVGADNDGQIIIYTNLTENGEALTEMKED